MDTGINKSLLENIREINYPKNYIKNATYNKNSFFGSLLDIKKEQIEQYEKNPFFSEMPKPENNKNNENESKIFFGAFMHLGNKMIMSIPKLNMKKNANNFNEEYEKYLKQFPEEITDYAFNEKINIKNENKKEENLIIENNLKFPVSYEDNKLKNDYIYSIENQKVQLDKKEENYYKSNLLNENCLMNFYKTINFDLELQKDNSNLFFHLNSPIDKNIFYDDLIYLIQGIPTNTFSIGKKFPFTFELNNEIPYINNIRFIGTLPDLTKNILSFFINFGTKMNLIQYLLRNFLFKINGFNVNIPFIFKKYYQNVNEIMIKLNEKMIYFKKLLKSNKMTLIQLYNKLCYILPILNIFYTLFNLNNKKNFEYEFDLQNYFTFYTQMNLFQKSHLLINSLIKIYYSFYTKDKVFTLVKNLLLTSLHSYLFFILYLLFTGEVLDIQNEYFILKSNNNIGLDSNKVPIFLSSFKNILLNNTILINQIKYYDDNYYSILTYQLNEMLDYLNKINITNVTSNVLDNFIIFKDKVFNKKIELMFGVNEKIINLIELEENEEKLKRLKRIQEMKNVYLENEKEEIKRKQLIKKKKQKYLEDIQEQILNKKRRIENEILKIKNENIAKRELEKEQEYYKNEILKVLKLKYEQIKQSTKELEIYGSEKNKWKAERNRLRNKRNQFYYNMYQEDGFNIIFPIIEPGFYNINKNYHIPIKKEDELKNIINEIDIEMKDNDNNNIKPKDTINLNDINVEMENLDKKNNEDNKKENEEEIIFNENDLNIEMEDINGKKEDENKNESNNISIFIQKENEKKEEKKLNEKLNENEIKEKEKYFKENTDFILNNIIYSNIVNPIIETAIDIGNKRLNENESKKLRIINYTSHAKTSKEVDLEVSEILDKIHILLNDNSENNKANLNQIEIPIQIIFQEFFYDIIIRQYKITNHSFVLMIKNKFFLPKYLNFFHNILLCYSGDLILRFVESVFDFRTLSFKSNSTIFLTNQLKSEIEKKYFFDLSYKKILDYFNLDKLSKLNLTFSLNNLELSFQISFKINPPLDMIFNNSNIPIYDLIFKKLLKHMLYNQVCSKTYSVLKNMRDKDINKNPLFLKITQIFNNSYKYVKAIQTYIYCEIIDSNWKKMINKINNSVDIFEIVKVHDKTIKKIKEIICDHPFISLIDQLYMDISVFYLKSIVLDYFDFNNMKNDKIFLQNLDNIQKKINEIKKYIQEEYVIGEFYNLKQYL